MLQHEQRLAPVALLDSLLNRCVLVVYVTLDRFDRLCRLLCQLDHFFARHVLSRSRLLLVFGLCGELDCVLEFDGFDLLFLLLEFLGFHLGYELHRL